MDILEIKTYTTFNKIVALVGAKYKLLKPKQKQLYGREWVKALAEYAGEPLEE